MKGHHTNSRFGRKICSARTNFMETIFIVGLSNVYCIQKRTLSVCRSVQILFVSEMLLNVLIDEYSFVPGLFNKLIRNYRRVLSTKNDLIALVKFFCVYTENINVTLLGNPSSTQSRYSQNSFYFTKTIRFTIAQSYEQKY